MVVVGEDDDLAKEARVLHRIVRWNPRKGITLEADPISREARAEELKTISTQATKKTGRETEEEKRQDLNERRWRALRWPRHEKTL